MIQFLTIDIFLSTGLVQPPPIDNHSRGVHLGAFPTSAPSHSAPTNQPAAQGPSVLVATYESSDVALWDLCPGQALFIQLLETKKKITRWFFDFGCVFFCRVLFCDLSLAGLLVVGLFVVFFVTFVWGREVSRHKCVMARFCCKTMRNKFKIYVFDIEKVGATI